MVTGSLGLGLLLVSLAASSLPPECLQPSSAQPRHKPGDRTKVRLRRPKIFFVKRKNIFCKA